MDLETIRKYCLEKKSTTESFPFGESTLVFKVSGKMFSTHRPGQCAAAVQCKMRSGKSGRTKGRIQFCDSCFSHE